MTLPASVTPFHSVPEPEQERRLVLRNGGRSVFLRPGQIDWIEAEGNYVKVHGRLGSWLARDAIARLEQALAPFGFIRIHRSVVVNLERVVELRRRRGNRWTLALSDGKTFGVGESYQKQLLARLEQ